MSGVKVQNWKRSITYYANSVQRVESVDDIVRIVTDKARYPSPVRAKGSHHSTTRCIVAEDGTVIDVRRMNKILKIDRAAKTITMQPGVLHIDAARELEKHGLQFYVNVELGNLTVGSGACGGTKDASYFSTEEGRYEFGQVAAYVKAIKVVRSDGSILEVTEADGELMEVMRSSYGMLGVVCEVTFHVKAIKPLAVEHVRYTLDEFADRLEALIAGNRSMMLYLFPFQDRVVVEYRSDGIGPIRSHSWQWWLRNLVWKTIGPGFGRLVTLLMPLRHVRAWLLDAFNWVSQRILTSVIRGRSTSPADQIIHYPPTAGFSAYTFSIWAFPREEYPAAIRAYFKFCQDYFRDHGYRCDLLNVGYSIAQDRQSLFSYTRRGPALTLDPVSTGSAGWDRFLAAYNDFCSQHNGRPLLNQTAAITAAQFKTAFGPEIAKFQVYRRKMDPDDRFYTPYFRQLFE
ncbi:MAG TPA: FAD-dependent oxidoreductase [Opitutaceae bacterium]|nr:FAD-dependent oxidoreductase [Opitutaceae bacterium]